MQNGCLEIPYYQQFVEFPIHIINFNGGERGEVWEGKEGSWEAGKLGSWGEGLSLFVICDL